MDGIEEEFSPDKWTQKELVKHLYREVTAIHSKLDAMNVSLEGKHTRLEMEIKTDIKLIDQRLDKLDQFRASTRTVLGIIGVVGTAILTGVVTLIVKVFELL